MAQRHSSDDHVDEKSQDELDGSPHNYHSKGLSPPDTTSEKTISDDDHHDNAQHNTTSTSDIEAAAGADGDAGLNRVPTSASAATENDPGVQRTKLQTILVVASLCAALFLAALDISIIATAVPTISSEFGSSAGYVWIGSAYTLANASCVPTWGKISDIFGRKPILLTAVGVFWVGSLLCGVAVNMGMLIAARAIQGIGGGGIIVLVNICISDLFSIAQRGMLFGLVGMVWAIASAVGPVIGGIFTTAVTWRWCFYINLPISGVGIVVLFFVLNLHNPRTPVGQGLKSIDWFGSLAVIGGTIMFLFGLEFGGVTYPWSSPTIICLLVFGVLVIAIFILIELKVARYPVMPLHLFGNRSNVACFVTTFCQSIVFMSGSYYLPLYFQGVLGVSSLLSGVYLLPYVLSLSFVSAMAGLIIKKTGNYVWLIRGGMIVTTLGYGLYYDMPNHADFTKIIIYQIVAGIGIGPNFQSPLIALQTNVEPRDIASATALYSFIRQLAASISVVVGGVVFNNEMEKQAGTLREELGPETANKLSGSSASSNVGLVADLDGQDGQVARDAYLDSLRVMFLVFVAFAAFGLLTSFGIRQTKLSKDHKEHKTGLKTLRSRTEGKKGAAQGADQVASTK